MAEAKTPTPLDVMHSKLDRLRTHVEIRRGWHKAKPDLRTGERIALASFDPEDPHTGTVTRVTHDRFRVTWDRDTNHRGVKQPRERIWYGYGVLSNFARTS